MFGMSAIGNAAAFMKLGDIKGEATDNEHKDWIIIESMSSPLFRAQAALDDTGQCKVALRSRGDTTLGDVVVVRELDKSSTKLQEASCGGTGFDEVTIDLISSVGKGKRSNNAYLRYKLTNVFVTSYSIAPDVNGAGEAVPMENFSLNFEEVTVEYVPQKSRNKKK